VACDISVRIGCYDSGITERMVQPMSILQTTDLKKYYGTEPNITKALDGVTLSVEQGEFVAIVGTSGSGKSTLLNMMGGLDVPTSGSVQIKGKELASLNDEQLTIFRRRNIGFIFQNYNLVPVLNVYENIVLPVELDGDTVDQKFMDEVVRLLRHAAVDALAVLVERVDHAAEFLSLALVALDQQFDGGMASRRRSVLVVLVHAHEPGGVDAGGQDEAGLGGGDLLFQQAGLLQKGL